MECKCTREASAWRPAAIRRMYSGTDVCAGQAHWQSTTLWKVSGLRISVGSTAILTAGCPAAPASLARPSLGRIRPAVEGPARPRENRPAERGVGKECDSTCGYRWWPYH